MNHKRKAFTIKPLVASMAILLTACGGSEQDQGTVSQTQQVFRGQAVDGYIARATVYIDTNNDSTRNAWEPFAFTDNEGFYSFNPNNNTDYCNDNASTEQAQFCLQTNAQVTEAVIRIDGGYDVLTGEPFLGQMSRRITGIAKGEIQNTLITPLTSLFTYVTSQEERLALLNSLQINEAELNINYLNVDGSGQIDSHLFNAAIKVHKVVTVLSDRLTDTYDEIGQELGTPNDASSAVYKNVVNELISATATFDIVMTNAAALLNIVNNAENEIRDVYLRKDIELPQPSNALENDNNANHYNRIIDVATSLANTVDVFINPNTSIDELTALASARAVETLVIKAVNEEGIDTTIDNLTSFITGNNNLLIDALLASLSLETANIASLAQNDFTGSDFDTENEIRAASLLPDNTQGFNQLGGLTLKISDLDLGSAPNNLEDKEVEFYFSGEPSALQGSFTACVKYIDDASSNGNLGEGNTRGELIDGFWSKLGASNTGESYSTLLTLSFLGSTYQAILKPAGEETLNAITYNKLRFDFDGKIKQYYSEDGFITSTTIPTTNDQCKAKLPSRVGI